MHIMHCVMGWRLQTICVPFSEHTMLSRHCVFFMFICVFFMFICVFFMFICVFFMFICVFFIKLLGKK